MKQNYKFKQKNMIFFKKQNLWYLPTSSWLSVSRVEQTHYNWYSIIAASIGMKVFSVLFVTSGDIKWFHLLSERNEETADFFFVS